jgi:hypothetical protein
METQLHRLDSFSAVGYSTYNTSIPVPDLNDTEKKVVSQMLDEIILQAAPTAKTVPKYGVRLLQLQRPGVWGSLY